jgi:hypothetical protein
MAALIEWSTIGQIFVESLAAGVIIVAAFAFGARLVAAGEGQRKAGRSSMPTLALAGSFFLIAAIAVAYGVYFTIDK